MICVLEHIHEIYYRTDSISVIAYIFYQVGLSYLIALCLVRFMWKDYFYQLQKKYNMRLSTKEALVIRLDGKDVTKSNDINLLYRVKGNFIDTFYECAQYFSKKYSCYAIFGTDEISFIISEPMKLIEDLEPSKNNHANEIIALFSQYFFNFFNNGYNGYTTFFHAKCFSIPEGKIESYIKYRSGSIRNVITTYFLKRNNIKTSNLNMNQKITKCNEFKEYENIKQIEKGVLYFNGKKVDIADFFNNDKKDISTSNDEGEDIEFIDIL